MNIQYYTPKTVDDKMKLMKFVYDNTDSFILNTFGYLWESRGWWDKFPIQLYKIDDQIAGMHAFTVDTKAPNTIKTYYIITGKIFRGTGIAKKLTLDVLNEFKNYKEPDDSLKELNKDMNLGLENDYDENDDCDDDGNDDDHDGYDGHDI